MARWYFVRDRQSVGPVSFEELQELAGAGKLQPADLVCQEGATGWVEARSVAGLFQSAAAVEPLPTLELARAVEPEPVTVEPVREDRTRPGEPGENLALLILRRAFAWDLGVVPVSGAEREQLRAAGMEAAPLQSYAVWRRSTLVVVIGFTAVAALLGTINQLTAIANLGDFNVTIQNVDRRFKLSLTGLGMFLVALNIIGLFAMPVIALLAALHWNRQRFSRRIVLWGWSVSFLLPLLLGLVPLSWQISVQSAAALEEKIVLEIVGLISGLSSFFELLPIVVSLVAGVVAACLRIKSLLPASVVPGWFLVGAAYLHALILFVAFVAINFIASSAVLIIAALLWVFGPIVYVVSSSAFVRPLSAEESRVRLTRVRLLNAGLVVPALVLFLIYMSTREIFNKNLLGFSSDAAFITVWKLLELFIGYFGRLLFMAVVGLDILMSLNQIVWFDMQRFAGTPEAEQYGHVLEQFQQAVNKG